MASLLEEFTSLITAFDKEEIEYAVCGGLAMAIHGFTRATVDIDLLIEPKSLEKAFSVAEGEGYDIRGLDIPLKKRAVEIRRVSQVQDVWETREFISFLGTKLPVVSREGLKKMKVLAGRPQDLVDIERLENEES